MATQQRHRLVRRTPLLERIKAHLDPLDFLLWLSEELSSGEWDDFQNQWSLPAGVVLNVFFMLARANASDNSYVHGDDVFADTQERGGSWLAWFASFIVYSLTLLSILNAFYTFWRKRHYRLFEASVDVAPNTPSAHRVPVDSSPISSSPLRYLASVLNTSSAESRAHPDSSRDVWELAVWDPVPISLRLFCLFSPGHILIYWLFLPLAPLDPRPSVTVVTTIALTTLLSVQLVLFQTYFTQQAKDTALIHGQVQNEYDTKFVRPNLHRPVRDVGTQSVSKNRPTTAEVLTYTPKNFVSKGFHTHPNPNYVQHYNPDGHDESRRPKRSVTTQSLDTPLMRQDQDSTPLRQSTNLLTPYRDSSAGGDRSSFGVHSHARSPLRHTSRQSGNAPRSRLSNGLIDPRERAGSPLKRSTTPYGNESSEAPALQQRFSQLRPGH